jgi:hypothetical protein
MPDVSLLIQSGFTPKKEWIERHFRVELDDKKESGGPADTASATTYNPEEDQDLFGSIFGDESAVAADETALPAEESADQQEIQIAEEEG